MSNRQLIRKTVKAFRAEYAEPIEYGIKKFLPRFARKGNDVMNAFIDQVFVDAPGFVRHAVRSQVDFSDMVGKGLGNLIADDEKMEVFIEEFIDLACIFMDGGQTLTEMVDKIDSKATKARKKQEAADLAYWKDTLISEDKLPMYIGAMLGRSNKDLRVYPTGHGTYKFNGALVCAHAMKMSTAGCAKNIIDTAAVNSYVSKDWDMFFNSDDLFIYMVPVVHIPKS